MSSGALRSVAEHWLNQRWYGRPGWLYWLLPLQWLFAGLAAARRWAYARGLLRSVRLPLPVIVVGNIVAGGAGKTPLLIALAKALSAKGYKPGIVGRGYGRVATATTIVDLNGRAADYGDEALMVARATGLPVAVGAKRAEAGQLLLAADVDLILSDDGLQHYALQRDLEMAVIPGGRRHGNGHLLPLGPLREPLSRLAQCDFKVVMNGVAEEGEYACQGRSGALRSLAGDEKLPLEHFAGQEVFAIAAIAHPEAFFASLDKAGLTGPRLRRPDHSPFRPDDFAPAADRPIIMTAKDAVKCDFLQTARAYVLEYDIEIPAALLRDVCAALPPPKPHGMDTTHG